MHERALVNDLLRKIEAVAGPEGGRVTAIRVRLGALSHFSGAHFCEHFEQASRGTIAEGASVETLLDHDLEAPYAQSVLLESVELEVD